MRRGEVVVVDVGAEKDGYAADITRTLPVSGSFTAEQRRVYSVVLKAQEEVIAMIRPGARWAALEARARSVLAREGFSGKMVHGVSHHLGMDVHDVGALDTLKTGMVITVEPGIYIPENDSSYSPGYRGFGIRIEDDVLVGTEGPVVLSSEIPKDPDTIEKLMRRKDRKGE
jgi:Xaa-Pro aminopeptidase